MAYQPRNPLPPDSLVGNTGITPAVGSTVLPGPDLEFDGTTLTKVPPPVRNITDSYTLQISDVGRSIVATSTLNINFFLPRNFPRGFKTRVYQGGSGQIVFQNSGGGTIITAGIATAHDYTDGSFVEVENLGNDSWIIVGNTATGVLNWSIYGDTTVKEGDTAGFCINYPSSIIANFPAGITITITGTNFDTAGWAKTLAQGIQDGCLLDSNLSFDGTSVLTVKPGANNPINLNFFAVPDYTETSDRTATLTISSPSQGSISGDHIDCLVQDVSKPTAPSLLFPTTTLTTVGSASSGQANIVVADVSGLAVYGTVAGTNIPALTWIEALDATTNTITLSANFTGTIANGSSLTYTPPGFWFDFSTSTGMTKDGSNNVSVVTDLINGYTLGQATGGNQPVWNATALNSLGGLVFDGTKWMLETVSGQISKTSSGTTAANATSIVLTDASSVTAGMLATDTGGLIYSSTTVTSVVGNTVHLNQAITNNSIASGSAIIFTPAASKHPLVNLLDAQEQKYTIIIVAKLSSSATSFYAGWDAINFQCSADSKHAFIGDMAAQENMVNTPAVGCPYVWQYVCDGASQQVFVNGQNPVTQATLTQLAPSNGGTGFTINVDDTSGFGTGSLVFASSFGLYFQRMDTIVSDTEFYITHDPAFEPWISQDLPTGTVVSVQSRAMGPGPRAAKISQQFVLGSLVGPGFSEYCLGNSVGAPATPGGCVVGGTSAFPFKGTIFEIVVVPRMLGLQEMRGVTLYLANKWGTATTGSALTTSAGATSLQLASVTGIYYGMVMDASTGILAGTTVTGVNPDTSVVKIDTPVQAPGLSSSETLTFRSPGFKTPQVLDITKFYPTFRDDFHNLNLGTGPVQWRPYYGSPSSPSDSFSTAYSATGHGSSNGAFFSGGVQTGTNETEWYLDVLNWVPWQQYSPFSLESPIGARSGELLITASPVAPEIANLIGYAPPNPLYTYTSGYLANSYVQQYGYWECRALNPAVPGMWPAYWITAVDGIWPPELDIMEMLNGVSPGLVGGGLHSNRTMIGIPTFQDFPRFDAGHMLIDASTDHAIYGAEISAISVDLYLNREKYASFPTPWDFHTFWMQQLNLAVNPHNSPDHVTAATVRFDYASASRRLPQTPTIPTNTQDETTALLRAMNVQPSGPRIVLINTLIASLKAYTTSFGQSFWNALDFLYLVAAHDSQAGVINWKNPGQIGTVVGSPTFTTDRGYKGSYGVSYIDTGINLSTAGFQMTAGNNHIACTSTGNINQSVAQSSSISTAVAGNETNATYNFRFGEYFPSWRVLNGTTSTTWNLTDLGFPNLFNNPGYEIASRNEYTVQLYGWLGAGGIYKARTIVPLFGNPKATLDNANLVIANMSEGITPCVHGGVFLTQDDIELLYPLIYTFLHSLGAI